MSTNFVDNLDKCPLEGGEKFFLREQMLIFVKCDRNDIVT
jgi:hypothetical protein